MVLLEAEHFNRFRRSLYPLLCSLLVVTKKRRVSFSEGEQGVEFLAARVSDTATYEGYFTSELPAYEDHFALWTYAVDADNNLTIR